MPYCNSCGDNSASQQYLTVACVPCNGTGVYVDYTHKTCHACNGTGTKSKRMHVCHNCGSHW